jgi:hypothetical protein
VAVGLGACERCKAGGREVVDVDDGADENEEHEGEGGWVGGSSTMGCRKNRRVGRCVHSRIYA